MKIVLAEERGGQERGERAFEKPIICVGRDPSSCDVVFDQVEWPMVSRQHAEFRLQNDKWTLVDKNSKFGTFLNGQRISEPTAIAMGARVQFGPSGPLLRIARVEGTTAEGDVKTNSRTVPQPGAEISRRLRRCATSPLPLLHKLLINCHALHQSLKTKTLLRPNNKTLRTRRRLPLPRCSNTRMTKQAKLSDVN
jgi:pSer/pThr/pTyr-binding forkhead associated (FHA) protein